MGKGRTRKSKTTNTRSIGGHWLPNLMIWGGVLLMLTGGVIAYPTLQGYLAPPDIESLEFSVTIAPPDVESLEFSATIAPSPTAIAAQPTTTPTAPPPVLLPETEMVAVQETPTAPQLEAQKPEVPSKSEETTEEEATPEPTPEPTLTPSPTPTPDPASLIPVRLVIPTIELDAPVVQVGWETKDVNGQLVSSWIVPNSYAAGWHVTSALLGNPGNTVLNGHHNIHGEVFRDLEDLEPGDEVIVYAGETPHYYAVTERHILEEKHQPAEVRQQNARFIMPTEDERLTMVTCWPYTNNTHRLVIVALPTQPTPALPSMVE